MNIRTLSIDKAEFKRDLSSLARRKKENLEQSLDEVMSLLEASLDALDFLKKADCIEDKDIQNFSRCAVFAQMYGTEPGDWCCRNQIAVIETQRSCGSSVIISKYGDVLVDEGILWLNENAFYGHYVLTRKIIDGELSWTEGIYSDEGEMVIPFGLLDNIHLSLSLPTAEYKGLEFSFRIYGKIKDIDTDTLKWMANDLTARLYLFISPYDVILSLHYDGLMTIPQMAKEPNGAEFMEKMAPYRVAKEVIQQELDRRDPQK